MSVLHKRHLHSSYVSDLDGWSGTGQMNLGKYVLFGMFRGHVNALMGARQ